MGFLRNETAQEIQQHQPWIFIKHRNGDSSGEVQRMIVIEEICTTEQMTRESEQFELEIVDLEETPIIDSEEDYDYDCRSSIERGQRSAC
jgi:hypothetical protein